ncbi:Mobile element protein [Geitlerinema sp. FC II]|nr:Mobile element protein [Geitlerinema sp. FC II]
MCLGSSNFQPEVLYSTERLFFLNLGYPSLGARSLAPCDGAGSHRFLPGTDLRQFSKKREIADQARSAEA